MSSYLPEVEQHLIGLILNHPQVWADLQLITDQDISEARRNIYRIIRQQLDVVPQGSVSPVILSERLKTFGINEIGGIDILIYLDSLERRGRNLKPESAVEFAREIKTASVRRQLMEKCDEAKAKIRDSKSFTDMAAIVDKTLSSVSTEYYQVNTTLMFDGFIDEMERRRENPVKAEDLGFQGPFPSLNSTLGSITYPGSFVVIGARTGGQKSALGFFYNTYLAEKYKLVCLHLDANEMPRAQLLDRSATCFTRGVMPLWSVKSGEWGQNKEWVKLWREECVPKINRIKDLIHYQNIGRMQPREVVAFIRRFYFKHVGRGNHLLINLDYLKGSSQMRSGRDQEHQVVGDYIDELKGLINEEITASIWTSVQQNRGGITSGKKVEDISDSEGNFAVSDRIIQQATDGFSMRFKIPEELGKEKNLFGNIRLEQHKGRDLIGKQFMHALMPVKVGNKLVKNYYNLDSHGFHFTDKGDLRSMVASLGYTAVDLSQKRPDEKMP